MSLHKCVCVTCVSDTAADDHRCLSADLQMTHTYNLWLGLTLALLSALLIGGSVILKKKALLRLAGGGQTRACELRCTSGQDQCL